ncbi:MAG: GWxTD domain-containing protein [Bacteroidota bacterium]
MKKALYIFIIGFCSLNVLAQKNNNLKAYLDYKNFYNPEIGNFVEIHLQFVSYTLKYLPVQNGLQSEVAVQYVFKKDNQIVKTDAYRLQSPLMRDSIIEDFYEIKRIDLKPGKYTLELNLSDVNSENSSITAVQEIDIEDLSSKIALSSLETAEMMIPQKEGVNTISVFSKSGYEIIPRISNYYSTTATNIPVYFEIYHPKTPDSVNTIGLKQTLIDSKTKSEIESFTRFTKYQVNEIQPVIRLIDISKLKSGEYILEYSLIDKENNNIHSSSYYFERFSEEEFESVQAENIVLDPKFQASITDDSLEFYISSIFPISKQAEMRNIIDLLKTKDKALYRKYLQSYWINTTNGVNTYESWLKYKAQVLIVQQLFKTNFTDGFETDRGRVYLQYGPPSAVITRENSPSDYPYEIWRYDKIKVYSNKRFIFYNPDLVNNTYRLLHSDMLGEVQNYRWQQQLAKRNSTNSNIDDPNDGNYKHFGGNSEELYKQY